MDTIKERVTQVLDSKGVLTRLKAELRANVFLAINDQDIQTGGIGLASKSDGRHREQLLQDPAGVLLVELVREFLRWCNLQFTLQVFDPEMQLAAPLWDRSSLEQHLGLAEEDVSAPLLLQLLSQHMAQQPLQQNSSPVYSAAQQAAGAAAPDYMYSTDDSLAAPPPQQQQPPAAAYASAIAAKQRASKSGSYVDAVEEDLPTASVLHGGQSHEEEEYAAVFVAARPLSTGSGQDSYGGSSGGSRPEQQQQSRPVRSAQGSMDGIAALSQQQVLQPAAMAEQPSDTFGHLDRNPAAMSLELHGLDSPPAAAATYATDRGSPGSNAAGSSGFSSPSASMEQQQGSVASPPAVAMPARLGPLEPLAQLSRPNKLAPLPAVKGPGVGSSSSRSPTAPDDLREELRRVGLLGTSATGASPGASSSGSPRHGAPQHNALYYGSGHDLESPGSSMAASAIAADVQPAAFSAAAAGRAGLVDARCVYGSAAGDVDFGSDDSSSDDDDFGIAEQRQLFEAARKQLSQSSQGGGLQLPQQQQQRASTAAAAQWEDDDDDSASDVEIPEDLSVPLEGLDAGDYSEVFRAGATAEVQQQPGGHSAAAAAAREQHGLSMDLHETGLSLSDRPGGIGLESADFRIDDDDF